MKHFIDGDQLVIVKDNFVNLQESPAVFFPLESGIARTVLEAGTVIALPVGDLMHVRDLLEMSEPAATWELLGRGFIEHEPDQTYGAAGG